MRCVEAETRMSERCHRTRAGCCEGEAGPDRPGWAMDLTRCANRAKNRGLAGPIDSASAYFCKHPRVQMTDDLAAQAVEDFITLQ